MGKGTKTIKEQINNQGKEIAENGYQLEKLCAEFKQLREDTNSKFEATSKQLEVITASVQQGSKDKSESIVIPNNQKNFPPLPSDKGDLILRVPKIKFPELNVENPREWISKCNCYFQLYGIDDEDLKMCIAELHLKDRANIWFRSWRIGRTVVSFDEFCTDLCRRFVGKAEEEALSEFLRLRQEGTVDDYMSRFEELMSLVALQHPCLNDDYFIYSFISGLKDEIKPMVSLKSPQTLTHALEIARNQESMIRAMFRLK